MGQQQEDAPRRLPVSFRPASWRATLRVDGDGRVGLSFDSGGDTHRFSLDRRDALNVIATLAGALSAYENGGPSHSETSGGMPSVEVSTPYDGAKVCP